MEDIFASTAVGSLLATLQLAFHDTSEYTCISIDATLKVAMSIKGQASYRASKRLRNEACFGDDEALRRVLTVRGQTGAVLAIQLIKGEDAQEVAGCLEQCLPHSSRLQVLYIMSDSPSVKLLQALQRACPNLKGLALDPIHLAIMYEYGQWRKRTAGSKQLRALLSKVVQHDPSRGALSWGPLVRWTRNRPADSARREVETGDLRVGPYQCLCPARPPKARPFSSRTHPSQLH